VTTLEDRVMFAKWHREFDVSPRDLAIYLNVESLEGTYPCLEDNLKRDLLRIAFNHWGLSIRMATLGKEWEETLRALFAAGAKAEVLCEQAIDDNPGKPESRASGDEVMASRMSCGGLVDARVTLKGFRYLVSRTDYLGVKLDKIRSHKRFKIHFDEFFMRSWCDQYIGDSCIEPHVLNLYYDDELSTWIMWNAMYEDYCGEFWDLLDHPERMMPGTWVE
jgi:hypothetical protein